MAERDPIKEYVRNARADRRVGEAAVCACGERRSFALIAGRMPAICFACDRIAHGRPPYEWNHVFGKHNSDLQIRVPINDHRAVLSVAQYDHWPPETIENSEGSILLEAAARIRGLHDQVTYMLKDCLATAEALERLDAKQRSAAISKKKRAPTTLRKKNG